MAAKNEERHLNKLNKWQQYLRDGAIDGSGDQQHKRHDRMTQSRHVAVLSKASLEEFRK